LSQAEQATGDEEQFVNDNTQFVRGNTEPISWLLKLTCDIVSKPNFQRAELYALAEKLCSISELNMPKHHGNWSQIDGGVQAYKPKDRVDEIWFNIVGYQIGGLQWLEEKVGKDDVSTSICSGET
jgi:hypothetical protein